MWQLNLPTYPFKTKLLNGKSYIFDRIRKKYVCLTPEEWVRQHVVSFLIEEKKFPSNLLSNEVSIKYNGLSKRCDTIVYNTKGEALLIAEYKSPEVEITQKTFDQIIVYNYQLKVKYLLISNGLKHYFCCIDFDKMIVEYLQEIPYYEKIKE